MVIALKREAGYQRNYCEVRKLGVIDYDDASNLQRELVHARLKGELPDTLLLLQHPAVITIGKSGSEENLIASKEVLRQKGFSLFYVDRGGDITSHSPGQLVGYSIMDIVDRRLDPYSYIDHLEKVLIQTLRYFSIIAHRLPKYRGIWLGQEKICSIGVKFNRTVSSHGFALNVNNDLNLFSYIHPCGIADVKMTSMSKALRREVTVEEVIPRLIEEFSVVFQTTVGSVALQDKAIFYDYE